MNYQSTKFWQTNFVIIFSAIALVYGFLDATTWMGATGAALVNYAYHDVKQKGVQ